MFNKKNIIKHAAPNDDLRIISSKSTIPDWYKDIKKFGSSNNQKDIKSFPAKISLKACVPFFEAMSSGHMIPLSQDIAIEQTDGGPSITYNIPFQNSTPPISIRDSHVNVNLPTPTGYSSLHFAWLTTVVYKIPKGYSALITHPLNRTDLPFFTLSGIIDGEYVVPLGNIPVFISSTFEGIIPAGTPIAQILLFKTEDWSSEEDKSIIEESLTNSKRSVSTLGWYRNHIWKKKFYN
jgi:hypothetical protein